MCFSPSPFCHREAVLQIRQNKLWVVFSFFLNLKICVVLMYPLGPAELHPVVDLSVSPPSSSGVHESITSLAWYWVGGGRGAGSEGVSAYQMGHYVTNYGDARAHCTEVCIAAPKRKGV